MISFTYDDGENSATVSWTPEYGFVAAGNKRILEKILFEAVEPNVVSVPVLDLPMRDDRPTATATAAPSRVCMVCGHPWHDEECTRSTEGMPCGCSTAVP